MKKILVVISILFLTSCAHNNEYVLSPRATQSGNVEVVVQHQGEDVVLLLDEGDHFIVKEGNVHLVRSADQSK